MISMTMLIGLLASIGLVVGLIFSWQLLVSGFDTSAAVERSTRSVSGLVLGVASAGTLIASELLGGIVAALTTAPSSIINGLLGVVGYLSISGLISIQPETWGLVVIGLSTVGIVLRDRGGS